MGRQDGRIEKGQSLRSAISARAWNRAQDAADIVLGAAAGFEEGTGAATHRAANIVYIKNESGYDVPECGVLGIAGVVNQPGTGPVNNRATRSFFERPLLRGATPLAFSGHADAFVVTLEPIANNAVGRAAIAGMFPCRVHITNLSHRYATIKDGDRTRLQSSHCGLVQLVWKAPGISLSSDEYGIWAAGVM
jgi:hypothetical protein